MNPLDLHSPKCIKLKEAKVLLINKEKLLKCIIYFPSKAVICMQRSRAALETLETNHLGVSTLQSKHTLKKPLRGVWGDRLHQG